MSQSIESQLISKLKSRLLKEGIDSSLLVKEKDFGDEIDYKLGDVGIAIFVEPKNPEFHLFWKTTLGMKYRTYENSSSKSLDEHMDEFIDDVIEYYANPEKRLNPVIRWFKGLFGMGRR